MRRPAKTELNYAQIFHWIRYKFKLSPSLNWPLTLVSSHLLANSRPLLASSFSLSSFWSLVVRLLWSFENNFYPYKMHVSVNAWDLRKYHVTYALCSHPYFTNQQSNLKSTCVEIYSDTKECRYFRRSVENTATSTLLTFTTSQKGRLNMMLVRGIMLTVSGRSNKQ